MSGNQGVGGLSSQHIQNGGVVTPIQGQGRQGGEIIFTSEAAAILERLNNQRMERNRKRAARRDAEEDNVSEDEGDDLSPYMVVVPSGGGNGTGTGENLDGRAGNKEMGPGAGGSPSEGKFLFGDEAAEKNTFKANNDSIPLAIFSLAKNGISPPLTLFMPDALDRIRSSNMKTMKHGTGESTKVTVMDVSDFPNEDDLDQVTWTTCYNRFLTFVEAASGEKIFRGFAATSTRCSRILRLPHGFKRTEPLTREFGPNSSPSPISLTSGMANTAWLYSLPRTPFCCRTSSLRVLRALLAQVPKVVGASLGRNARAATEASLMTVHPIANISFCVFGVEGADIARSVAKKQTRVGTDVPLSSRPRGTDSFGSPKSELSAWDSTVASARSPVVHTPSTYALSAATLTTERSNALAIERECVVTPYLPAGWLKALRDCNLLQRYPNLVHDLSFGSPIEV
ncbi:hypothetical protein FB45DRAFT_1039411 [Roridomyces roridus]|uniref:Uncharacterized protein n=1 Tax=Roridomyces roridus TaxID=1738132 RepID=A0AAD7B2G4_9AGAR|nr:hypothetical protein FB45DRAFT_1039411 [Roridomyces roridus]